MSSDGDSAMGCVHESGDGGTGDVDWHGYELDASSKDRSWTGEFLGARDDGPHVLSACPRGATVAAYSGRGMSARGPVRR